MATADNSDLPQVWKNLFLGIESIFKQEYMTRRTYMDLYSKTFMICSNTYAQVAYNTLTYPQQLPTTSDPVNTEVENDGSNRRRPLSHYLQSTFSSYRHTHHISPQASTSADPAQTSNATAIDNNSVLTATLYESIKTFLCYKVKYDISPICHNLHGEQLLLTYVAEWKKYHLSSHVLSGVCSYVDRHWAKREKSACEDVLPTVYGLAVMAWWDELAVHVQKEITQICVAKINRLRHGEPVDTLPIAGVVSCLVEMDYRDGLDNVHNLYFYKNHFENCLLKSTEQFYSKESESILNSERASNYIYQIFLRLHEENDQVTKFLHDSTREALITTVERAFVLEHLPYLFDEFKNLLIQNAVQDIAIVHELFKKHPDNLKDLCDVFEQHIYQTCLTLMKTFDESQQDPAIYVQQIIDLHCKFYGILQNSFCKSPMFNTSLDKAFGRFINQQNKISSTTRCAETLAKYTDQVMRKSSRNTSDSLDADDILSKIIVVFSYLDDKDVFQKFYGRLLAKRLVAQNSVSDDFEMTMLSKLKQSCGYEYTAKLQRMFQDVNLSRDISDRFKHKAAKDFTNLSQIDFNVMVLSAGSWPFSPQSNWIVPNEIQAWHDKFAQFYNNEHNGRKLTWLLNQSRVELVANCFRRKYIFQVNMTLM
ncbi:hypothetical protein GJ496_009799 [Pomphorhynchus laevis]|nr:hypothetical protein GJ496_009799 [Pomphorhynchus laevis]